MTSDSDDALSWDGDDADRPTPTAPSPAERKPVARADATLPEGWNAVGKGSGAVGRPVPEKSDDAAAVGVDAADTDRDDADDTETPGLSTAMLLILGVVGGIYLLYSVGWVVGGLRLKPLANLIVADAMYVPWFVLAVAAPALWFLAVWVLTRAKASWIRIGLLLLGVVLLVPWPFVTVGVVGS